MKNYRTAAAFVALMAIVTGAAIMPRYVKASVSAPVKSPYFYNFNQDAILQESSSLDISSSPYWWLNSGGRMFFSGGIGRTVQGELAATDKWRLLYASSNPVDTDNGYHPQNIFRLVTRSKWQNFRQEMYFRINKTVMSASPNRNASNGLLTFQHYVDGSNTYYIGIRVDGYAIVKKKTHGTYYTMASKKIFDGAWNKTSNPNLLPKNIWIGMRTETVSNSDGTVTMRLYLDQGRTGNWKFILETKDDGKTYGGAAISAGAYAGIRTDFMDVDFEDYRNTAI